MKKVLKNHCDHNKYIPDYQGISCSLLKMLTFSINDEDVLIIRSMVLVIAKMELLPSLWISLLDQGSRLCSIPASKSVMSIGKVNRRSQRWNQCDMGIFQKLCFQELFFYFRKIGKRIQKLFIFITYLYFKGYYLHMMS